MNFVGQKKGAQKGTTPKTIKLNKCHIVIFVLFSTVGPASDVNDIPATAILDNTMQLDKLHAGQGGEVKRRKPSRDHIHHLSRDLDAEQQAEVGPLSFVKTSFRIHECMAELCVTGLSSGVILFNGRGFIGYPKGRNRDIKLAN